MSKSVSVKSRNPIGEIVQAPNSHGANATWPGTVTHLEAVGLRTKWAKRLRRFSGLFQGASELASLLSLCGPGNRCGSGTCPVCGRHLQQWAVVQTKSVVYERRDAPKPAKTETIALSIVPPGAFAIQGQLQYLDMGQVLASVVAKVDGTSLATWGVFGLDVSFNDLTAKGGINGFQVQVYGIVETINRQKLRAALRKLFSTSDGVSKPIRTRRFEGSAFGASYAFKFRFIRRVSYWDAKAERQCWRTRKVSLKATEHVELMLALHRLGLDDRLDVIGLIPAQRRGKIALDWLVEPEAPTENS